MIDPITADIINTDEDDEATDGADDDMPEPSPTLSTDSPQFNRMEATGQEGGDGPSAPLMVGMDNNDKHGDVKRFFYNNVCIEDYNDRYIGLMIENGFDSLDIIKTLTIQDLVDIGVDKLGHRKKIINEIRKL